MLQGHDTFLCMMYKTVQFISHQTNSNLHRSLVLKWSGHQTQKLPVYFSFWAPGLHSCCTYINIMLPCWSQTSWGGLTTQRFKIHTISNNYQQSGVWHGKCYFVAVLWTIMAEKLSVQMNPIPLLICLWLLKLHKKSVWYISWLIICYTLQLTWKAHFK